MFTIDDIVLICEPISKPEFKTLYEETIKHFTFTKPRDVKFVPLDEIKKYGSSFFISL